MKKILILLIIAVFSNIIGFTQSTIIPSIGVSQSFHFLGIYSSNYNHDLFGNEIYKKNYNSSNRFFSTNIIAGVVIKNKVSIGIHLQYQLMLQKVQAIYTNENPGFFQDHLIGTNFNVKFFNTKKIRPFIGISILTEIKSNFKDKTLDSDNYSPWELYFNENSILPEGQKSFYVNFYKFTPLVINTLLGCGINITNNFEINIAFGYGLRSLKTRYGIITYDNQWKPISDKREFIGNAHIINFHMLVAQIGVNYDFPAQRKKPKTNTP